MHDVGLPNCPPENFIQIGIGGWAGMRSAADVVRRRGTQVMSIEDIDELGPAKAAEMALEMAWKGAKAVFLSFDIDSIDPAFAPGTGSPEPGGIQPREAIKMVRAIAAEGLCGMEMVEISPPYDVNENTSQLGCKLMLEALAAMVVAGKLGHREKVMKPA
jgi:agmatinase